MQPKNLRDDIDTPTLLATLLDQAATVQRGDLASAEAMLINQASALQALFVRLAERAMEQSHMPNLEGFMRLALRAQSQCRATLETLSADQEPADSVCAPGERDDRAPAEQLRRLARGKRNQTKPTIRSDE